MTKKVSSGAVRLINNFTEVCQDLATLPFSAHSKKEADAIRERYVKQRGKLIRELSKVVGDIDA